RTHLPDSRWSYGRQERRTASESETSSYPPQCCCNRLLLQTRDMGTAKPRETVAVRKNVPSVAKTTQSSEGTTSPAPKHSPMGLLSSAQSPPLKPRPVRNH